MRPDVDVVGDDLSELRVAPRNAREEARLRALIAYLRESAPAEVVVAYDEVMANRSPWAAIEGPMPVLMLWAGALGLPLANQALVLPQVASALRDGSGAVAESVVAEALESLRTKADEPRRPWLGRILGGLAVAGALVGVGAAIIHYEGVRRSE